MARHQSLRIYGAGGCGSNIARSHQSNTESITGPSVAYLDTSLSNLTPENIPFSYVLENVDGSGMERGLNAEPMRKHISPALSQFPPGDFNIVIFSGSGGTGSVFGPLIMNELINRDKPVIAAVIGDTDSAKATKNTLMTLRTLSKLSASHKAGIAVLYAEMVPGANRREADEKIQEGIRAIQLLANGTNAELDSQDLVHWLRYEKVTEHAPGLNILNIYNSNEKLLELHGALSVASLYSTLDDPIGTVNTAYRVKGYTNNPGNGPLHFVLTQVGLTAVVEKLERKLDEHHSHAETLSKQHISLHSNSGDDFLEL